MNTCTKEEEPEPKPLSNMPAPAQGLGQGHLASGGSCRVTPWGGVWSCPANEDRGSYPKD